MAYFRKVKNGWRAEVERAGIRRTATRATKAEAQGWAVAEEAAILAGARGEFPRRTLAEAVERYRREVTDKKTADRKSTRLNSSHLVISYAVFCLKKKKKKKKKKKLIITRAQVERERDKK